MIGLPKPMAGPSSRAKISISRAEVNRARARPVDPASTRSAHGGQRGHERQGQRGDRRGHGEHRPPAQPLHQQAARRGAEGEPRPERRAEQAEGARSGLAVEGRGEDRGPAGGRRRRADPADGPHEVEQQDVGRGPAPATPLAQNSATPQAKTRLRPRTSVSEPANTRKAAKQAL
ncbi:hypothetical protein GCM10020219_091700 [Nonomuraea dietziae]